MKKILPVCLAALLGLFVGLLYNRKSPTPKTDEKHAAPVLAKSTETPSTVPVAGTQGPSAGKILVPKEQGKRALPTGFVFHGAGADYALVGMIYKHPELKLRPEDAADLQEIFSTHYGLFAKFQAKISQASIQPDGSTLIQIPAFPAQAQQLVEGFMSDVQAYYNGNVPAGVASAVLETYRGYTNSAGENPISLKITVSKDPSYRYDVTRRTLTLDPATRQVLGVGESVDQITNDLMLLSPYSELSPLFPRPKS